MQFDEFSNHVIGILSGILMFNLKTRVFYISHKAVEHLWVWYSSTTSQCMHLSFPQKNLWKFQLFRDFLHLQKPGSTTAQFAIANDLPTFIVNSPATCRVKPPQRLKSQQLLQFPSQRMKCGRILYLSC